MDFSQANACQKCIVKCGSITNKHFQKDMLSSMHLLQKKKKTDSSHNI